MTEFKTHIEGEWIMTPEKEVQRLAVTQEDITAIIYKAEYQVFGGRLTVCVLTLRNGFMVTGEAGVASEINFDELKGRRLAFEDARRKIWALEGYVVRERLARYGA